MKDILSFILGILFLPITLLGSWVVVHPQEEKILLFWGELKKVIKDPGLYFSLLWGRTVISVSTKRQTFDLHRTVVADGNGNPIVIAGVCTYQVSDSIKAALSVEKYQEFLKTQAMAVLKQVSSKYPYESASGHSLKNEAKEIGGEMVTLLQSKVKDAGISIVSFELSDLSYAPEIAQAMLVRQQAQALVDARKVVVEGAVEIVHDAILRLEAKDIKLTPSEKSKIVGNLLIVICGEAKVQPTYPIQGNESAEVQALLKRVVSGIDKLAAKQ